MKTTMKMGTIKSLTVLGICAVFFGALAAGPAKADDRCNDNRAGIGVRIGNFQIALNTGGGYAGGLPRKRSGSPRRIGVTAAMIAATSTGMTDGNRTDNRFRLYLSSAWD